MNIIKTLIISVLVAVTEIQGGDHLQGTISDDIEQKTGDLQPSILAEITKSDVEITLGGLKTPEDGDKDAIEANDNSKDRHDKRSEDTTQLESIQEATTRISSSEDVQKITHTSDDNASFIHVKEKIARQGSDEDYAEADEQQKDGNYVSMENTEPRRASGELKNSPESDTIPEELITKTYENDKIADISEKSHSFEADDIQSLFKSDNAEVDVSAPSRRMLSFNPKLLDPKDIFNGKLEPVHEMRSGQNSRESIVQRSDHFNHGHQDHHKDYDNRRGYASDATPFTYPSLPSLPLFQFSDQPQNTHFHSVVNNHKQPHSLNKGLASLTRQLQDHQLFDGNQNNNHFKEDQQLLSHPFEQHQHLQSFRQLQPLQSLPPLQPLSTLKPMQTLHTLRPFQSFQTWQPLEPLHVSHRPPYIHPSPSVAPFNLQSTTSFEPLRNPMDSILSRLQPLQDPSHHSIRSETSHQFSDLYPKNWNIVTSYSRNSHPGGY